MCRLIIVIVVKSNVIGETGLSIIAKFDVTQYHPGLNSRMNDSSRPVNSGTMVADWLNAKQGTVTTILRKVRTLQREMTYGSASLSLPQIIIPLVCDSIGLSIIVMK